MNQDNKSLEIDRSIYDQADPERILFKSKKGIDEEVVREISKQKNEPEWMLKKRLDALKIFQELDYPSWGPDLSNLDLNDLFYYLRPDAKKNATTWEEVPEDIKKTFDKLGIPEAEKKALAGVGGQYDSEVIYHNIKKEWDDKGVIFLDCDEALKQYPELFKEHFMTTCIPVNLHKFSALHAAVWSGGTFIYVPKNVTLTMPLQAYFRMNAKSAGQFEHTLIIVDEGAEMQYIEGCSAPQYTKNSLHAGCVEIHVKKKARARYSSIENWSKNTYNLNTKRAVVDEDAVIEWVNGNMGSKVTMLYPASVLKGDRARSDFLGIAYAGSSQHQDTGCKVYHCGNDTKSNIVSKSISKNGGITTYRGEVYFAQTAKRARANVKCDTLMMDAISKSNTYPNMSAQSEDSTISHEATVGKINDDQIFYLMSRGLSESQATQMIVSGFIEPIVKELPLEYAVELNRLVQFEMEGSIG